MSKVNGLEPTGWKVLIEALPPRETTASGLIALPKEVQDAQAFTNPVGRVVAMGEACYMDPAKFGPDPVPWCKVDDYVVFHSHSGQTISIRGAGGDADKIFRVINDDDVQMVTDRPDDIRRYSI